jgi:hypothetical protein
MYTVLANLYHVAWVTGLDKMPCLGLVASSVCVCVLVLISVALCVWM